MYTFLPTDMYRYMFVYTMDMYVYRSMYVYTFMYVYMYVYEHVCM